MPTSRLPAVPQVNPASTQTLVNAGLLAAADVPLLNNLDSADRGPVEQLLQTLLDRSQALTAGGVYAGDLETMRAVMDVSNYVKESLGKRTLVDQLSAKSTQDLVAARASISKPTTQPRIPSISRLAARAPRPRQSVPTSLRTGPTVLTASGEPAADLVDEVARALTREVQDSRVNRPVGRSRIRLASVASDFPDDRRLGDDAASNAERIDKVTGPSALIASGGICAPVATSYQVTNVSVADRPVRDGAMAAFNASRGGVRYVQPHTLAAVTADGPAALWTEANDVNPTNPATKPHATFTCQPVLEAYVDAVTSIVQFGNFQARYFPEQIAAYLATVDAVHARLAEGNLLAQVSAGSTQVTAGSYELGASRDVLAILGRAAAAMRWQHRTGPNAPLRFVCPSWVIDEVQADLARALPGDSGGQAERLAVAAAEVEQWFAVRHINVTWTEDSPIGANPLQGWPTQTAGPLAPWPLVVQTWLYPEGSWLFLDGGELNLGMVRDSTLNRTNDFQMFSETFEKAIFTGVASWQVNMRIAPTGASVGAVAPTVETVGS